MLRGAKVSAAAAAPPRSRPAMVPRWDVAQGAGSAPRVAEPSREPLCHLLPPACRQLPPRAFPWERSAFPSSRGKPHLTTPGLEAETGELGFVSLPQNMRVHSHPWEMGVLRHVGCPCDNPVRGCDPALRLRERPRGGRGPLVTRSHSQAAATSQPCLYSPVLPRRAQKMPPSPPALGSEVPPSASQPLEA